MVTWVRQSGSEIELQDADNFNAMAEANGWKRKGAKPVEPEERPKRTRRTKAEMEAARAADNG